MYGQPKTLMEKEQQDRLAIQKDFNKWRKIVAEIMGLPEGDPRVAPKIKFYRENQTVIRDGKIFHFHIEKVTYRYGNSVTQSDPFAVHFQFKMWADGDEKTGWVGQYSHGSAIRAWPLAQDIFRCLVDDAVMGQENFYNYCDNYGIERDMKNWDIYKSCMDLSEWFQRHGVYSGTLVAWQGDMQEEENLA